MNVESVLGWAAEILRDASSDMAVGAMQERLEVQFQGILRHLEVFLSLDRRFLRTTDGTWQLNAAFRPDADPAVLVQEALASRQRAVEALLNDRQAVQERAAAIEQELAEVDKRLARLGHRPIATLVVDRRQSEEYSLEYHLRRLTPERRQLLTLLHQAILALPASSPTFNKFHIAYCVQRRFAMIVPHQHNLEVLIKTRGDLDDPDGWTRDTSGRRLGMERGFRLESLDGIPYAMRLIQQVHGAVGV